ncbi:AMIN domain-containing protein [Pseudodesulfovibrio sp. F-1]|uniref:AMIN domain-containing protein n=1 Tax=Pseudodesulfovibrio alkaliphilus TaxID=2661613 RepID=A0A7K1KL94_9BACT|nr:AMIN domain-containing protein [Pseudodesulfovibrio alkaliphilus]MUM76721.1 AMIN domain-containing protein [Pseudodesulfovibrio alkaliphilus]
MKRIKGHSMLLAAAIVAAGLAAFALHGGMGRTSDRKAESAQVRMAVDPTVIPSDMPFETSPGPATEQATGQSAEPAESQAEIPVEAPVAAPRPPAAQPRASDTPPPAAPSPAPSPAPEALPAGGTITAASLESTSGGFVLTVVGDRPIGPVTHLTLASPPRLVLDLAGAWTLKAPNVLREEDGPVRHVVIGVHPDKLRLVVHLREESLLGRLGDPVSTREGDTLRVTATIAPGQ